MLTKEQREFRNRGLGASDMNALAGASKRWRPIDVYRSKTEGGAETGDEGEPEDEQRSPDQMRGDYLEGGCRQWYAHIVGAYVTEPGTLQHPERPLMLATPDGLVHFNDGQDDRGLEIKCPRYNKLRDWCDGEWPKDVAVPAYYLPQLTCEAAVLGVDAMDMAVLLGDELRILTVPFDQGFFDDLCYVAEKFWHDFVVPRRPPPVDGSASYAEFLRDRHPRMKNNMLITTSDPDTLTHARTFYEAGEQVKQAEAVRRLAKNNLQAIVGDNAGLDLGNGNKVTWTNNSDSEVVDYKKLIADLNVPQQTLDKYTTIKPGPRVFRGSFKGWKT